MQAEVARDRRLGAIGQFSLSTFRELSILEDLLHSGRDSKG